ncbi:MAG: UDP-glucuronic acid decarboxylase family protein [bacterium]
MKEILITGGAGFIGSHLCEKLLYQGNKIICLDNFFTGNEKNIEHLKKENDFEIIKYDVENPYNFKVDEIYNLACPAAPIWYQKNPIKTIKTNVLGAINVLELAKKLECPVLQASTSEVYGDPKVHPQKENYFGNVNPVGIRACYDEGKRCAETLFFDYRREYNVNIKVVRIFNTYGPRMAIEDGRVVSNFIIQALHNENITMHGDGSQTRSFCYVDDLVNGLIAMMESDKFTGPVNMGNPDEFTIKQLADLIIKLTDSNSKIIYENFRSDDPMQRNPNINLAKQKLGWKPSVGLEEGLKKTIAYFKTIT